MSIENIKPEKIEGIYDIQALSPAFFSGAEILLVIILFTSLITYLIWRIFYSRKGVAKRQIKKLQTLYHKGEITEHDAVYRLCSHLQQGLKLKQLKTNTDLPEKLTTHSNKWREFKRNISNLRYKKNSEHELNFNTVLSDSLFWLKVWP